MTERHIGTCSQCGGKVMIHAGPWYGINPPEPTCSSCGAGVQKPVMQMQGGGRQGGKLATMREIEEAIKKKDRKP